MKHKHRTEAVNEAVVVLIIVAHMEILFAVLVKVVRKLIQMRLHLTIQMIFPHFQNSKLMQKTK
jgi:hypothetical protein